MAAKPNIVFIFSDQQHWQALSFIDDTFHTPNQAAFAKDATVFSHAFCSTPQCSPSRSSLMTGLYPSKTGVMGNIDMAGGGHLKMPSIGKMLQDAGYRTAYYGKWHLGKDPVGIAGWDDDYSVTEPGPLDDQMVTKRALAFLDEQANEDRPFALFLSYNSPHDIYQYGGEARDNPQANNPLPLPDTWFQKDLSTVPSVQKQFMTDDQGKIIDEGPEPAWQRYREIYRDKNTLYDNELGHVFEKLKQHGWYDEAVMMTTSDHGDMDAHHKLIYKGPFLYEQMMRVPLMVKLPKSERKAETPEQLDYLTVNVDIVPTLLDFASIEGVQTDGQSLRDLLHGSNRSEPAFVVMQYYSKQNWVNPIRQIRTRQYKYNLYQVHGEELYDLVKDPQEINNLADDPAYAEDKAVLKQNLCDWIKGNDDQFFSYEPSTRDGEALVR